MRRTPACRSLIQLPPQWVHDALLIGFDGNFHILRSLCLEDAFNFPSGSLPTDEIQAKFRLAHEIGHGFIRGNPVALQSFNYKIYTVRNVGEAVAVFSNPIVMRNYGRDAFKDEVFADAIAAYLYSPSLLIRRMVDWINQDMPTILK